MTRLTLNAWVLAISVAMLAGCVTSRPLMPTPQLYTDQKASHFEQVPPTLRTPAVNILFVTDRAPEQDESGNLRYGYQRSGSLAFGSVQVDLGDELQWDALVKASVAATRDNPLEMAIKDIEEVGRFPPTPAPYRVENGKVIVPPDYLAKVDKVEEQFRAVIRERLAVTPRKEVFIYIHGYHNSFEDAAFTGAEFWHFLGREGVPILYTWPAGYPGLFGYTYDRESSEFTVFHCKQLISRVSEIPEVEALHIVAHSRGTDVALAAVRELMIYARGAGIQPLERYKIRNLVFAAPDLDVSVAAQRMTAEQMGNGVERFTMYFSPSDEAISLAERLFASPRGRLGHWDKNKVAPEELTFQERKYVNSLIRFEGGHTEGYGHSYYRTDPGVSSDIILLLRYGLEPGAPGRPLKPLGPALWEIPPGYPGIGD